MSWELSLYDQHRKPHEPITDDTEIAVSPRSLHSELMCPICLDMLRNTYTAKECLHRFCQECITTALRSSNKECPTCRKRLVSKRSLRPDPNFDALISKIFPDREEYDLATEKALARISKYHSSAALQRGIEEGMRDQAQMRKKCRMRTNKDWTNSSFTAPPSLDNSVDGAGSVDVETNGGGTAKRHRNNSDNSSTGTNNSEEHANSASLDANTEPVELPMEVELTLCPHPRADLSTLPAVAHRQRFLKTVPHATVGHLKKYLCSRIQLDLHDSSTKVLSTLAEDKADDGEEQSPTTSSGQEQSHLKSDYVELDQNGQLIFKVDCSRFEIFVTQPGHKFLTLDEKFPLRTVIEDLWKVKKPLVLHFALVDSKLLPKKPSSTPSAPKTVVGQVVLEQPRRVVLQQQPQQQEPKESITMPIPVAIQPVSSTTTVVSFEPPKVNGSLSVEQKIPSVVQGETVTMPSLHPEPIDPPVAVSMPNMQEQHQRSDSADSPGTLMIDEAN